MLKRRDFLTHSMAAASATLVTGVAASEARRPGSAERPHVRRPFDAVVVDARYSDSRRFAAVLQRQGASVFDTTRDLGLLWYGELGAAFRKGAQRIAGLTPHSDLFICESFAREHGARLIFKGAHDCRGVAQLTHSLKIGDSLAGLGTDLRGARQQWPTRLAQQLPLASREHPLCASEHVASRAVRAPDYPGMLFSWAIA